MSKPTTAPVHLNRTHPYEKWVAAMDETDASGQQIWLTYRLKGRTTAHALRTNGTTWGKPLGLRLSVFQTAKPGLVKVQFVRVDDGK